MKFHTIRARISIIFLLALFFLLIAFYLFYAYQEKALQQERGTQYKKMMKALNDKQVYDQPREVLQQFYTQHQLAVYEGYSLINQARVIERNRDFTRLVSDGNYYLHLHLPFMDMLLRNTKIQNSIDKSAFMLVGFILFLVIVVYSWIMKSLAPLDALQNKVKAFGKGEYEISTLSEGKDEIAQLSNEFHNAAQQIHALMRSRQLFLRTIMHELKTPIAKGRIVSGLLDDLKQKERFDAIFTRLDTLIEEFAKIEQVVSKNYRLKKKPYRASELVNAAVDMLMLDELKQKQQVEISIVDDFRVFADFDLYVLALKNLLDNALKYAEDKKVKVTLADLAITISNKAKPLPMKMEEYFKPFHNDVKHQGGLGLGIYIVKSIIDLHEDQLIYAHEAGVISFTVKSH